MDVLFADINWEWFGLSMDSLYYVIRIFVAALCGFCIGYERKTRSKEAGIRTHTIVCLAAALLMVLSKYGFGDLVLSTGEIPVDVARIAAQVVTGIGFLGAGIIFYRRDTLHGLTTAAGIWATAAIGMAIGSGMYILGIASTILLICLQMLFHAPITAFRGRTYLTLKATVILDRPEVIQEMKELFNITKFVKFKTIHNDSEIIGEVEFITNRIYTAEEIYEITASHSYIKTLEKTDEI